VASGTVRSKERAWRADFDCAFNEGRFRDAAAIYGNFAGANEQIDVVLRAAKAHLHGDPAGALRLLLKVPKPKQHQQVERDALLAEAYARTRDFESADLRLNAALDVALKLKDGDLIAAVGYRVVRRHLHNEDPGQARAALELARKGQSRRSQLYATYAETLILPYEERVVEQAERLIEFLRLLDPNSHEFVDLRAWATHALACLVRELCLPQALPEIERQLAGVPWPADFAHNLFQTLKSLAWARALQGDYFNAFRHLKHASEAADTTAWKVVAACDRSYLARCFDEHRWSRVELDEAERLASSVDWNTTIAEERMGLLLLAELFGAIDASRSAMYLARYRELGEIKSSLYYRHDARRAAYAQYSTGVVEILLGNTKRGLARLRESRRVFERFGYDFRVARSLLDEFEVTRNRAMLPGIDEKLRHYRQSWLMSRLREASEDAAVALPPMQHRVFEELCRGKSTLEISQALGRSRFTISNHIKQILRTFDVKSRAELLAEAVRRGLVKDVPSSTRQAAASRRGNFA